MTVISLDQCVEGRCVVRSWHDDRRGEWVIQHGDNPEAVIRLAYSDMEMNGPVRTANYVAAWFERVHAYEARMADAKVSP